jgi:hypothetical protein
MAELLFVLFRLHKKLQKHCQKQKVCAAMYAQASYCQAAFKDLGACNTPFSEFGGMHAS